MLFDPKIHSVAHLVKSVLGRIEFLISGLNYGKDELLVVNYHSTPEKFISEFRKQILFLKSKFNIISPAQLNDYFSGQLKIDKCNLLITFDDGLKNNLHAVRVLDEYGIKAFFFLIPAFIHCPPKEQKAYYLKNIRPVVNNNIDSIDEDFTAMTESDIKKLLETGHQIGSHTYAHTLVAKNSDLANSEKEIVESKKALEEDFSTKIDAYCSINNTLESTGEKEKKLIAQNYQFHFTTIPGSNSEMQKLFIRRRNIECFWMKGAVIYALGKWDLKRWKNAEKQFVSY